MSETEQIDHGAEALRLLECAKNDARIHSFEAAEHSLKLAAVHSSLAIAEGQERVAEKLSRIGKRLDSITEVSANTQFGSGKRYLKVKP